MQAKRPANFIVCEAELVNGSGTRCRPGHTSGFPFLFIVLFLFIVPLPPAKIKLDGIPKAGKECLNRKQRRSGLTSPVKTLHLISPTR